MEQHHDVVAVHQKVLGLERGHDELRQDVGKVEQRMERGFARVDQNMADGFASITSKLDAKTTPQWQAYGLIVTVLLAIFGAFGTVVLSPLRETSNKHEAVIESLRRDNADDQRRTQDGVSRLWEEAMKTARDLAYLRGQLNPMQK
jgi:hypothetical protein